MHPLIWQIFNGNLALLGLGVAGLLVLVGGIRPRGRVAKWGYGMGFAIAAGAIWFGSLPVHPLVLFALILPGVPIIIGWAGRFTLLACLGCALGFALLSANEIRYRQMPDLSALSKSTPIYVIGDSVSSGTEPAVDPWPHLLGNHLDRTVTNLAKAGAITRSALSQTSRIPPGPGPIVMVEIGGNDQFSGHSSRQYQEHLSRLLEELGERKATVLVFELPLMPFRGGYGRVQRRLTAKHSSRRLIPKSILASVMAAPGATLDGIHLSEEGHRLLAGRISRLFRDEP